MEFQNERRADDVALIKASDRAVEDPSLPVFDGAPDVLLGLVFEDRFEAQPPGKDDVLCLAEDELAFGCHVAERNVRVQSNDVVSEVVTEMIALLVDVG